MWNRLSVYPLFVWVNLTKRGDFMKTPRKSTVLMICYLSGLLLAAGGFGVVSALRAQDGMRVGEEARVRAMTDAVGRLESMAEGLAVAVATDLPLPALIELRHDADLAAAALGQISFSGEGGALLRRFAACTAEISGGMADDLARGQSRVPDYALLVRLRDCAIGLVDRVLPAAVNSVTGEIDDGALAEHFSALGRLYYDGVGSDVQPPSGYLMLMQGNPLPEEDAREIAEAIAGKSARLSRTAAEGEPARYCFTAENLTITVTAVGGHLLSFLYDRTVRPEDVGAETARAAAEKMILTYAPEPMTCFAEETKEGTYIFTFIPIERDYLRLSERVLVGIDAASGRLSLWDANRYYRYHTGARTFPEQMLSPETAANLYGSSTPAELCITVRPDGREILCYRIGKGDNVIYVNAITGKTEETM